MGNHRVLFEFSNLVNMECVLKGEPWSFDKYLLALKRMMKHIDVRSLVFDETRIWVQVHNLPIRSFSMAVVKDIASIVGKVDKGEIDDGNGGGSNFLRVRITINLMISLCRGHKIAWRDG